MDYSYYSLVRARALILFPVFPYLISSISMVLPKVMSLSWFSMTCFVHMTFRSVEKFNIIVNILHNNFAGPFAHYSFQGDH